MSQFFSESLTLKEKTFTLLRDLIHARFGIYFENGQHQSLADKLSGRVMEKGFSSFLDYYYLLKYDPNAADEWERVMDALSVRETYFYREIDQIRAVVDELVPRWLDRRPGVPLTIWSAACATGEEPLSIAMALNEAGLLDSQLVRIVASDASAASIAAARRAVYRDWSFRNFPAALRDKYFVSVEGGRKIAADLHRRVSFMQLNLLDETAIDQAAGAPIIFCRNVFIYFSPEAIRKVAAAFHRRMPSPGWLFLGASESLLKIFPAFELETMGKAFFYLKK